MKVKEKGLSVSSSSYHKDTSSPATTPHRRGFNAFAEYFKTKKQEDEKEKLVKDLYVTLGKDKIKVKVGENGEGKVEEADVCWNEGCCVRWTGAGDKVDAMSIKVCFPPPSLDFAVGG
jgi:hypothetical protein